MFLSLATRSLLHRKSSVILTVLAMTVSIFVMLGVDHIRHQAKDNFASSVSGVDLIVGTRTGSLNLLLYSVFRVGAPTSNMNWQSYQAIANDKQVNWALPISLGDSHRGYRVLGTTPDYFDYFSYGSEQQLEFHHGHKFEHIFDVVLGAKVAASLRYQLGDRITLAHGIGKTSFSKHDKLPFEVVGILKPTGTPVDQTVHVSLQGLEAVHLPPAHIAKLLANHAATDLSPTSTEPQQLTPKSVTAVMVGMKSRMMVFNYQRKINTGEREPLLAILPGVALSELWQNMAVLENTLRFISALVFVSALLGLCAMLLTSIRERTQEIALLRMIGASPGFIFCFIELEALLITVLSALLAAMSLVLGITLAKPYILATYGISIDAGIWSSGNLQTLTLIFVMAVIAAIPPALTAYYRVNRN